TSNRLAEPYARVMSGAVYCFGQCLRKVRYQQIHIERQGRLAILPEQSEGTDTPVVNGNQVKLEFPYRASPLRTPAFRPFFLARYRAFANFNSGSVSSNVSSGSASEGAVILIDSIGESSIFNSNASKSLLSKASSSTTRIWSMVNTFSNAS